MSWRTRGLKSTRSRALRVACVAGVFLVASASTYAFASARDADGSRMQARSFKLGTTQKDHLMPPRDRVDWRSFKLDKAKTVTISVSSKAGKAGLGVSLTDARGKSLGKAAAPKGSAKIQKKLEPGIYYVAVTAKGKAAYSISIR